MQEPDHHSPAPRSYVFDLRAIRKTGSPMAGGKGANLGELFSMDGIRVPDGFCISAEVFKRITVETAPLNGLLEELVLLKTEDPDKIAALSSGIRRLIQTATIPGDIVEEITSFLAASGEENAYAIRSSATAEDLPHASFAGQQDTYLNITGKQAVLSHISKCWASLFTDRAVIYRIQNGFDHRQVFLAVLVQKMVFPHASGILFTAHPVTGNRKVSSVDAGFGLGDTLVSGLVTADSYTVRGEQVIDKRIAGKSPVLTDPQLIELARIGKRIESHFGCPQDIEWCWADDAFYIVQSRPITTLYPVPERNDGENHVYVSVGHQQMMTDALKPLGLSFWQLTALRPMYKAGGRLFVDITQNLITPAGRKMILEILGQSDPLITDALTTILERGDFINPAADNKEGPRPGQPDKPAPHPLANQAPVENDLAIVSALIQRNQQSVSVLQEEILTRTGIALFDFILEDIQQSKKALSDPQSVGVFMTAMNASFWINDRMDQWLGEKNAANILSQSAAGNITSEMGLALLDLADTIRPYPAVIDYLQKLKDDNFLKGLAALEGGPETRHAIGVWLQQYGMRGAGEIDITQPRWNEKPSILIPLILNNIKNFEPGAGKRMFEQGLDQALKKEQEILERLKDLPDGSRKVEETKKMISLIRNFIGYREYPKYGLVSRYFIYKQALLREAGLLVQTGLIREKEDVFYLSFEEFRELVNTGKLEAGLVNRRKEEHEQYKRLSPPRVLTSDGEILNGMYKRANLPPGAIPGLPVSSGVVEGRARVILQMEEARLEEGDILITIFTDPSWTPLFVGLKGLVTEVGGLMTHGSVIAREYGLPAVVGVENATRLIKDGQRIRVHGTDGYIEIL